MTLCRLLRSLSGKSISLCKLCGSRCLCGGIAKENAHHRGTEIAQRTTETNSPTDSEAGASIKPGVQTQGTKQKYIDSAREAGDRTNSAILSSTRRIAGDASAHFMG